MRLTSLPGRIYLMFILFFKHLLDVFVFQKLPISQSSERDHRAQPGIRPQSGHRRGALGQALGQGGTRENDHGQGTDSKRPRRPQYRPNWREHYPKTGRERERRIWTFTGSCDPPFGNPGQGEGQRSVREVRGHGGLHPGEWERRVARGPDSG